jgi:hypothetical protein
LAIFLPNATKLHATLDGPLPGSPGRLAKYRYFSLPPIHSVMTRSPVKWIGVKKLRCRVREIFEWLPQEVFDMTTKALMYIKVMGYIEATR